MCNGMERISVRCCLTSPTLCQPPPLQGGEVTGVEAATRVLSVSRSVQGFDLGAVQHVQRAVRGSSAFQRSAARGRSWNFASSRPGTRARQHQMPRRGGKSSSLRKQLPVPWSAVASPVQVVGWMTSAAQLEGRCHAEAAGMCGGDAVRLGLVPLAVTEPCPCRSDRAYPSVSHSAVCVGRALPSPLPLPCHSGAGVAA